MKNFIKISWLSMIVLAMPGYAQSGNAADEGAEQSSTQMTRDLGYYFGYTFGNMLRDGGAEDVDLQRLMEGLQDSLKKVPPDLDPARREVIFGEIRSRQLAAQEKKRAEQEQYEREVGSANLIAANTFLQENAQKSGVRATPSGLQYEVLTEAEGANAASTSTVVVHYEGRLLSGEVFDRSGDTPAEFGLHQVIEGWTEGLQLMSVGDKYRLFLPPGLAYGAGSVGKIPPNSLLIFDIELLEIK